MQAPGALMAAARLVRGAPQPVMPLTPPKRGHVAPELMLVAAEALPANVLRFSRAQALHGLRATANKRRRRA